MKLYINKSQYGYSTTCKDKDKQFKTYLSIGFKKGDEPKTDEIEILNAFFTCYKQTKDNKEEIKPKLFVMSFKDIGKAFEEEKTIDQFKQFNNEHPDLQITDEDIDKTFNMELPF
jgi:hypothetical protein